MSGDTATVTEQRAPRPWPKASMVTAVTLGRRYTRTTLFILDTEYGNG